MKRFPVLSWSHVRVFVGGLTHAAEVRRNPFASLLPPQPRQRLYKLYYDQVLLLNIHEHSRHPREAHEPAFTQRARNSILINELRVRHSRNR